MLMLFIIQRVTKCWRCSDDNIYGANSRAKMGENLDNSWGLHSSLTGLNILGWKYIQVLEWPSQSVSLNPFENWQQHKSGFNFSTVLTEFQESFHKNGQEFQSLDVLRWGQTLNHGSTQWAEWHAFSFFFFFGVLKTINIWKGSQSVNSLRGAV